LGFKLLTTIVSKSESEYEYEYESESELVACLLLCNMPQRATVQWGGKVQSQKRHGFSALRVKSDQRRRSADVRTSHRYKDTQPTQLQIQLQIQTQTHRYRYSRGPV